MRKLVTLVLVLLIAAPIPAFAQDPSQSHADVVDRVKNDLMIRGVIPIPQRDNCDSFQITVRVAWELRAAGAKLFLKNAAQNGCTWRNGIRYSHDAIAFPNGFVDLLRDAGPPVNGNWPVWQWKATGPSNPATLADPFNLDEAAAPPPPPPAEQLLPSTDLTPLLYRLDLLASTPAALARIEAQLAALEQEQKATREDIAKARTDANTFLKQALQYVAPIVGALLAGRATK